MSESMVNPLVKLGHAMQLIRNHFQKSKKFLVNEIMPDAVLESLKKGYCPDCNANSFCLGPKSGVCQHIECEKCGMVFQVGPFSDGWTGEPFIARKVGWNWSGSRKVVQS